MLHTLVRWLLIGSVVLLVFSLWHRNDLPQPAQLPPQLLQAPIQIQVNQPVIDKEVGGISYHIQPLYQYELFGLVVSQHDATSWQDYLHQQWNDKLNISDVCVLWGNNAIKGVYQEFKFWNGQFTCNFLTRSTPAFQAFDQTAISNNHLLTASPELMKKIAETWSGEWWTGGGGGTVWDSMAYDPDLDLLYIGVGNAGPWNRYLRNPEGKDNLFTASIVAIRPDTGEYVWHYQETPNDGWDYTSTQHMILADIPWQGEQRKVILHAPKNGFFFVVDRENGKFLSAVPYARVNWALGYDANGRPIENPDVNYRDKPALVRPSPMGAHNWHPMSYSEQTHLVYIPVIDGMFQYGQDKNFKRHHGYWNTGTSTIELPPGEQLFQDVISRKVTSGSLLAWDPVKQQKVWEVQHPLTWNGGVLSTAGNLVFQGTADGRLVAYRADNGDKVWEYKTQAGVIAPPVTYSVDGEQYVTVMAGWGGAFGLTGGMPTPPGEPRSRILTFKLGGTAQLPALPPDQLFDPPPRMAVSDEQLKHGANVYNTFCVGCHGVNVVSNKSVPDLRWMAPPFHENFKPIVLGGALKGLGMVGFADVLNEQDADAVHAYILDKANDAKEKRDNPDSAWWLNLKTRTYETLGELMSKYL